MRHALVLLPWFDTGGSEIAALDLVAMLVSDGWRVHCIASLPHRQALRGRFEQVAHRVTVLAEAGPPERAPLLLGEHYGETAPELVFLSNCEFAYELLPWLRARWPEATFVDLNHIETPNWRRGGYPAMSAVRSPWLELQLTVSAHLRDWMVGHGACAQRVEVLYLHADPEVCHPDVAARARVRAAFGIAPGDDVLLFAGRLTAQKRPHVLAAAVRKLVHERRRFTLLVAGDGEQAGALADGLAEAVATRQVRLLGSQPSQVVRELMQAADILVLPSAWEGIALVLYEAMACGMAVVATDVGGQRELVTPDCGVLVPLMPDAAQSGSLAAALGALLDDRPRRDALQRAARLRVLQQFTPTHTHRRFRALLECALGQPHGVLPSRAQAERACRAALAGLRWDWALARARAFDNAGLRGGRASLAARTLLRAGPCAAAQAVLRQWA